MTIEIRNLSITSKVVQREAAQAEDADPAASVPYARPLSEDWRAECRRMILELLELQRER
jgi:hypothetical protein